MALTRQITSHYAKLTRKRTNGTDKEGCGDDRHMLVGSGGSGPTEMQHRSLIQFPWDWSGIKRVIKVEIALMVEDDSTHFTMGSHPKVRVERATNMWSEGTSGENVWTAAEYQYVASSGSVEKELTINPVTGKPHDGVLFYVDVTPITKPFIPKSVVMADGTAGGGEVSHGYVLRTPGKEIDNDDRAIFHSWHATTAGNRPFVLITYDPVNQEPLAPTLTGPSTTAATFGDSFEGQHSDPDLDALAAREIVVYQGTGSTESWRLPVALRNAGSDETTTGRFSVPLSLAAASLKLRTNYEWVARTRDPAGLWGPYSARRALRITSSAPSVDATPYSTRTTMVGAKFGGTYSDPDGSPLTLFVIQMQTASAWTDAAFADEGNHVWDTGETGATKTEIANNRVAREYGGQPLNPGTYTYRIKVRDQSGVWSEWDYDNFQLTGAFNPDPGDTDLTTQIARNAPVRVALYKMGTNRGRGALIGYVDDPIDLGHSAYMNQGGELYFSLPALHPYCPSIEAHQTHYAVEQYYGDRYRELGSFQGIITDFDADTDSVVFYGTDYLGLLQTAVDERYDPTKADKPAPTGSKYIDKTIDNVIRDQLTYHKGLADSPVGFITVPAVGPAFSALAERVTIYSTYAEALPFIGGLINSHKQGTGREARLYVKPNATYTTWTWNLIDNWGKDRPNIRLEYGGLLTDFRVVALGDFGTRVLGVGQKRGEVKVYRAVGTGGLNEAQWGRRAKTRFYQDIIDENDLKRRVKEDALVLSKVGKRIALALRADMLSPFDGWDVGDSIVVDIERGVVDTDQYGSGGYWTILGVEWRYYPDGHSDLTLTVLPKKTSTSPDPDLIPSINPGVPRHWQAGYGVPKKYGELPYNTPTLLRADGPTLLTEAMPEEPVTAQFFEDLNTRCVYEVNAVISEDPEVDDYTQVSCPSGTGTTIWYGSGPPDDGDYAVGDFYTDTDTGITYGPKSDTAPIWPVAITPGGVDTIAPPQPTVLSAGSPETVLNVDGTTMTNVTVAVGYTPADLGPGGAAEDLTDLNEFMLESTRWAYEEGDPDPDAVTGEPDWRKATVWISQSEDNTGIRATPIVQPNVVSTETYWVRVRALDVVGNISVPSDYVAVLSSEDTEAPPAPAGIVVEAGMSTIGVRWDAIAVGDLAYVEVGIRTAEYTPAGEVTPIEAGNWVTAQVYGTLMVITGLENGRLYDVRLRSVDLSNNVLLDPLDLVTTPPIVVKATEAEAGWVDGGQATPVALPGDALVWDEAMIADIFAGNINADWITAGTLKVGGAVGTSTAIEVYDASGNLIGKWSDDGIEIMDPANPQYKMTIAESSLIIQDLSNPVNPITTVSVTPRGIDAASVTFGSARGGHNLVPNSSFETGAFAATAVTTVTNDVTAEFTGSRLSDNGNVTTSNAIAMTTVV